MPSPSSSLATLRPDLAQSFEEFDLSMNAQGYIAQIVAPIVEVKSASGNFGRIPIDQLLQSPDTARAPGSGYNRGRWSFTPDTFATKEHGWEEPVDDNEAEMYANYFNAEVISSNRAIGIVQRDLEQRVANMFFNTTTFTGSSLTTAVGTAWSAVASATPVTDVEAAVQKVFTNSGLWPNCLIINRKVFRNLRRCTQITDLLKYGGFVDVRAGAITPAILSEVFDLQVIVAGSVKNSANEGATAVPAQIWSDSYAMVASLDLSGSNDIRRPTVARIFHWGEDGSTIGGTVESYRDESKRSDIIRVRNQTDEKLLYKQAGHLLSNIT